MTFSSPTSRSVSSAARAALLAAALSGCALLGGPERAAREAGFARSTISAGGFALAAYTRFAPGAETLTVYIESDGAPWARRDAPPSDPTPREPLALRLASSDPSGAVAWLARPCQYLATEALAGCDSRYWRRARYAPEVIGAMSAAVDRLLEQSGARRLVLVGYSGGGAVAALLAARRSDVRLLVTVGGVLDTSAWTSRHAVTPLDESLNPADAAARLSSLPQTHYVGEEDKITPPALAEGFAARIGARAHVERLAHRSHERGWTADWAERISLLRSHAS